MHQDFHLEAVYSQSEMDFSDIPDEDEDDDEVEEEKPAAPQRPAKKNGPKELAEFHAKQVN